MKTNKIFIIEDNIFYGNLLMSRIEDLGYSDIELFTTGEDCMKDIHKQPEIIFLDHNLPDVKGLNILKEIKSTYPQIQCVMISGQATIGVAINALKYGATDYLLKGKDDDIYKVESVIKDCIKFYELQTLNRKKKSNSNFLNLFL